MRRDSSWRRLTWVCLALGAVVAPACEAVIGLGAYSEGTAPDAGEAGIVTDGGKGHDVTVPRDASDSGARDGSSSDATASVCSTDGAASCSPGSGCAGFQTSCSTAACVGGCCAVAHRTAGTACSDAGDVCDEAGACVQCTSSNPCAPLPCQLATCSGGACSYASVTADAACNANGGSKCDQAGNCVECLASSDCAEQACLTVACSAGGACVYTPANSGGNCGSGGTCTDAGTCNECSCPPPEALCQVSTCSPCGTGNAVQGTHCDGGASAKVCSSHGTCVACNVPTDCPAPTTECSIATCVSNVCAFGPATPNTPCNVNGGSICNSVAQCVMCTPSFSAACTGSTPHCSSNGECVECTSSDQCPNSTPYCISSGTCVQCTSTTQCPLLKACSDAGVCTGL